MLKFHPLAVVAIALFPLNALAQDCISINTQNVPRADVGEIRETWLGWTNAVRAEQNLPPLTLDDSLNETASNWSLFGVKRGYTDHKRTGVSAYYAYAEIEDWFEKFGITFPNISGKTFSESIGWGPYRCKKEDCTRSLTKEVRTSFDFFIGEKEKAYRPHYTMLMSAQYTKVGLGIAVDESTGKYFLTVHYATDVDQTEALCSIAQK